MLIAYGIPTVEAHLAATARRGGRRSPSTIGFPVVLKLHSETLTHKTDVGGVALNLADAAAVRQAYAAMRSEVGTRGGREALSRRHRAADGQARRIRGHCRQQPRSAVRSRAALRFGRQARGGLPGSRARPAAAEHHAGPAHDGADQDLRGARGRPRRSRRRPPGARATARPVQHPRRRAAAHQGNRDQSAARLIRPVAGARRAGDPARGRDRRCGPAGAGHPPLPGALRDARGHFATAPR